MRRSVLVLGLLVLGAVQPRAQSVWETFSNDYTANCLAWTRGSENPVIPPSGTTWKGHWTGSPEFLSHGERMLLYYHGNGILPGKGKTPHDRIGVAEISAIGPMQLVYHDLNGGLPAIDVGVPGEFDDQDVSEPAAVEYKGKVLLFYGASGRRGHAIGLATSSDGEHFTKEGMVIAGGEAPDVVAIRDSLFLIYQKPGEKGYTIHVSVSTDGKKFYSLGSAPVLEGEPGHWDAQSVTTPRIWKNGEWYYMLYGGSADRDNEPEFFGLARSRDLFTWERHPGNPVFGAGVHAGPDGGAIWYPAIHEAGPWLVMLYEGSRGRHAWDLDPGICMAWISRR
jgi:hypothetical protein